MPRGQHRSGRWLNEIRRGIAARAKKTASQMMRQREPRTVCLFVIPSFEREKLGDANHVIDHDADR
jgi:hypothetical protein